MKLYFLLLVLFSFCKNQTFLCTKGLFEYYKGNLKSAEYYFHLAYLRQPNSGYINCKLAQIYNLLGRWESAYKYLEKAIRYGYPAKKELVDILIKLGEYKKAKEILLDLKDDEICCLMLADIYLRYFEFEKLQGLLKDRMRKKPSILIYQYLVDFYIQQKDYEKAKEILHDASKYLDHIWIYLMLARLYKNSKEYEKAKEFYLALINKGIFEVAKEVFDFLLWDAKETKEALNLLQKTKTLWKDDEYFYNLGICYLLLKDEKAAYKAFKKAALKGVELAEFHLAELCFEKKKYKEALEWIEKFLNNKEIDEDMLFLKYFILLEEKKYKEALRVLKDLRSLCKDKERLYYQFGVINERLNKLSQAEFYFLKTIFENPKNGDAFNYIGYMYAERGIKLNKALRYIKKALEIEKENPYFIDSLGWVYYQMGKIDKAIEELQKAVELLKDPVVYEHLGDAYLKKSLKHEALSAYSEALNLFKKEQKQEDIKRLKGKIDELQRTSQ